jgi:hypothetical protein
MTVPVTAVRYVRDTSFRTTSISDDAPLRNEAAAQNGGVILNGIDRLSCARALPSRRGLEDQQWDQRRDVDVMVLMADHSSKAAVLREVLP